MAKKRKATMLGNMLGMGMTNLVGVGMIGATAGMVNTIPAGTAHDIAGMAPALQSTALLGANLGRVNNSFGGFGTRTRSRKRKRGK